MVRKHPGARELNRDVLDQTVKRFVALGVEKGQPLPEIPYPQLQVSRQRQQDLVLKLALDTSRPVIGMMPGAEYGPAKCWPLEYFRELAEKLDQSGFAVWVLGSEKDRAAGDVIAANGHAINLCGQTELVDVIDLVALCQQVVSNDSGLMHVAAAVGVHVHGIYGSSSPLFTPPLTVKRDIHSLNLDCSPCFERHCPLGHLRCLKEILPSDIQAKVV